MREEPLILNQVSLSFPWSFLGPQLMAATDSETEVAREWTEKFLTTRRRTAAEAQHKPQQQRQHSAPSASILAVLFSFGATHRLCA